MAQGQGEAFPRWPFVVLVATLAVLGALYVAAPMLEARFGDRVRAFLAGGERGTAAPAPPPPVRVTLAGLSLTIPRDIVRFEHQQRDADQPRLDLALRWPSLRGAGAGTPIDIAGAGLADVLFVSLSPRDDALDPTRRLGAVYNRFLEPDARQGPPGLTIRRFQANSGYDSEELIHDTARPGAYFVRCAPPTADAPAMCLRELRIRDRIDLVYRFPRPLIDDWRRIEDSVLALVAAIGLGS